MKDMFNEEIAERIKELWAEMDEVLVARKRA